jgi:hypothetical protein
MRRKWGDKDTLGPGREQPLRGAKGGLQFYFLKDERYVIVPGLTGK